MAKRKKKFKFLKEIEKHKSVKGLVVSLLLIIFIPTIVSASPALKKTFKDLSKYASETLQVFKPRQKLTLPKKSPSPSCYGDTINCYTDEYDGSCVSVEQCQASMGIAPSPKQNNTNNTVVNNIDPDLPVHCKVNENCGGGTIPLKQSECNNSTCCQIGDKWIFYKDKNKCKQDQSSNQPSYNYRETLGQI